MVKFIQFSYIALIMSLINILSLINQHNLHLLYICYRVDDFQNITHYLCHIFQRTHCPVSIPVPTYYAHLAASRARKVYAACLTIQNQKNIQEASTSGASTSSTSGSPVSFPPIHKNHRFRMFYI